MRLIRLISALAALGLVASGCNMLKDPIEPWQVDISYIQNEDGSVEVAPPSRAIDGPFGFVVLTNDTDIERGFAIEELAVFEKIRPDASVRISIDEVKDNTTYRFFDHLHENEGIEGTLVAKFIAEDER